ncbi:LysM peptidoglycan-binding domain-containing protein [Emticicia sp. BO119]|uniref:LysM peptidoglycan-binding domain-containing protein n=1 Tax=Emticicia sp. BO119 TaxID=2757768 RepID=UPI0015F081F9|nr:LysM peptidoglycan-binding domain-containing protein [Emticicia sp. BO119]MBA4852707.1 LysM peptidoglycan-binding domain-containing protein [Emticicia sp. BO119]
MLRYFFTTAFFVLYLTKSFSNSLPTPLDSIGIEKKNGKLFVLHKIEQGETLYSVLKRYNSSEKEFYATNPEFKKDAIVAINQVISIPLNTRSKSIPRPRITEGHSVQDTTTRPRGIVDENGIEVIDIPEATPKENLPKKEDSLKNAVTDNTTEIKDFKPKTHTVAAGDILFSIANRYKVKVWQLREWNKLTNDILKINQILIVEKPANLISNAIKDEKKEAIKPKPVVNPAASVGKPKTASGPAGDVEKTKPSNTVITKPLANKPQTPVPNAPTGKKYSEQGIAEVIEAGSSTNKYLALHRTAPVGTLIKIVNEANGQSVWVKVIGKLSGPGDAIIKISPKAFEKLQPKDKRIRASLSYAL